MAGVSDTNRCRKWEAGQTFGNSTSSEQGKQTVPRVYFFARGGAGAQRGDRMDKRFDVYFAGEVLPGQDPAAVRDNLGRLFKADAATLDKLFSGKPQVIKRDCEQARAAQYQQAMARAGARALVRPVEPPAQQSATPAREMTLAERIAALANADDDTRYRSSVKPTEPMRSAAEVGLQIAPVGTVLLRPEERRAPAAAVAPTTALNLDSTGARLSEEPPPPPAPPATEHIALDAAGGTIPNLPGAEPIPEPDLSALDLSPPGTDFSDCAGEAPPSPELDLSELEVAPAGSDVLEAQYRHTQAPPPPPTDHLTLDN